MDRPALPRHPRTDRHAALALLQQQRPAPRPLPMAHPRQLPPDRIGPAERLFLLIALLLGLLASACAPGPWF